MSGPLLFARYAFPPNRLGYCGGDDPRALLEQTAGGVDDADLRRSLRAFEGAWPYLELIAAANARADPLDADVVEAYWIGNHLLDRVTPRDLATSIETRFRGRVSNPAWSSLVDVATTGAVPHHSFHVFGVYPFVGLLREGTVDQPLQVLDRCRIRWGRVVAVDGDTAIVRSRHLSWDGHRLRLGFPDLESAVLGDGTLQLSRPLHPGDWCALHWDWVCDRITGSQLAALQRYTALQLAAVNDAPARVLA